MMNQPRTRKAPAKGESGRHRPYAKIVEETPKATKEPQDTHKEHGSKNKIPNSIRYDLENSLVGLCDVWFEDIKPYLLRNNIKLHVRGGCQRAEEAEAGGDRGRLPAGAPGCSHLDPGAALDHRRRRNASYAGCCSVPQAISRTQSRKQLQPPFKQRAPLSFPVTAAIHKVQCRRNSEGQQAVPVTKVQVDRMRRRGNRLPNPHYSTQTVPRLCRTYSSPAPMSAYIAREPSFTTRVQQGRKIGILQDPVPYHYVEHKTMRDQASQTDPPIRRRSPHRRRVAHDRPRRTNLPEAIGQNTKSKSPIRGQNSPAKNQKSSAQRQNIPTQQQKSPAPKMRQKSESPQRHPRCLKRTPSPPAPLRFQHASSRSSRTTHISDSRHDPQCQDGPFDRIGVSYDMDVHVLYETPRREETPANTNLILMPHKNEKAKKTAPWR